MNIFKILLTRLLISFFMKAQCRLFPSTFHTFHFNNLPWSLSYTRSSEKNSLTLQTLWRKNKKRSGNTHFTLVRISKSNFKFSSKAIRRHILTWEMHMFYQWKSGSKHDYFLQKFKEKTILSHALGKISRDSETVLGSRQIMQMDRRTHMTSYGLFMIFVCIM